MSTPCEDMYGMPSGFTAILLQFSFAYWMTTYPITSPFAANWHVSKFGGAAGGQGGQNGEEGGGIVLALQSCIYMQLMMERAVNSCFIASAITMRRQY